MKSFDLLSVRLIEQWRRPDRMHGPDGSDRQTQEEPNENALRLVQKEPRPSVDRDEQHQGRGDAFGHGVLLLGSLQFRPALAALHACQGGLDTISNARGKRFGPLANGLRGDAYRVGSGRDRSTEQFYGASFKHDGR